MVGMPHFATYFYFLYSKTITKYNYKLFPKNPKIDFLKNSKKLLKMSLCVLLRFALFKNSWYHKSI